MGMKYATHASGQDLATGARLEHHPQAPGKRTRTDDGAPAVVQARAASGSRATSGEGHAAGRAGDWVMDDGLSAAMGLSAPDGGGGSAKVTSASPATTRGEPTGPSIPGGLPAPVRAEMEQSFGQDFSDVRIHEGPEAAAIGAVAYTQGSDIYFQPGRFDPFSTTGKELLGHELAHVVQQRGGRVAPDAGPMGKELALSSDTSLEAEADAAGARAARGESAGISGGSGGGAGAGAPIQRYAAANLDGAPWRLSATNKILTKEAASHELYAEPLTIANGEAALAAAGSFIRLAGQVVAPPGQVGASVAQHGLQRVTASYRARGATADAAATPSAHKGQLNLDTRLREPGLASLNNNGAGALVTPSQCIDAARVVMGVTGGNLARDLEMPVGNVDGANRIYARQPGQDFANADFQNMKHAPSSTESGALTALSRQLLDFLDSRELRALADQEARKTEVARFRVHARQLQKNDPSKAWVVLHSMKEELPAVYTAFTTYAGIDAAAAPEVGEALVTYIAETKAGRAFKTNSFLYDALVARLGAPTLAGMGITAATPAPKIKEIVEAAANEDDPNHAHHADLSEVNGAHGMWNMHWAGIVLKDGPDYASLENDASTKETSRASGADAAATATGGDINASWRFQLYGSSQPGQSFHEQMLAGGDFGDFASTTRMRRQRVGEAAIGKAEHRVYALRMPAGVSPALVDQMRWELYGHDQAAAAGAPADQFAAVLTTEVVDATGQVKVLDVRLPEREMPPRVAGAIEQALEMIDVWRLRSPGPPLVSMDALRERMRVFHYAVKYLLSLDERARPVDSYVSVVSRNARKLELDAEIRPRFTGHRVYAASVEARRHPSTIDGFSIGLLCQMLTFLDTNLLWHYERDEADQIRPARLEEYRAALAKQRQEAVKYQVQLEEARAAFPVLDRCDALFAEIERVSQRLFPTI